MKKIVKTMLIALGVFALSTTSVNAATFGNNDEGFIKEIEITENDGSFDFANIENYNVVEYNPFKSGIVVYGQDKPSNVWNLKTSGAYEFSGLSVYHNLYTNYMFTGATTMKVSITLDEGHSNWSDFTGKVTLYKYGTLFDSKVDSFTAKDGKTTTVTFTNLSSSSKYFLKFEAPMSFNGKIWAA